LEWKFSIVGHKHAHLYCRHDRCTYQGHVRSLSTATTLAVTAAAFTAAVATQTAAAGKTTL
jgi:hypothetical protein